MSDNDIAMLRADFEALSRRVSALENPNAPAVKTPIKRDLKLLKNGNNFNEAGAQAITQRAAELVKTSLTNGQIVRVLTEEFKITSHAAHLWLGKTLRPSGESILQAAE